jgi:tetratricopeptide (TPR) repeat protein
MNLRCHDLTRRLLETIFAVFSIAGLLIGQTTPAPQTTPATQAAQADTAPKTDPVRQQALDLYKQGKLVEAMPLFENLCATYPKDIAMWEGWGMATLGYSQTLQDADQRKKARALARTRLVKAKELGDNSNLLQILLPTIPEDGGERILSDRKDVDNIMQRAEADYSRGDYDKAREGYLQALLLEPKNYAAALFMGDVFYKQHVYGSAGEWFAKAIEIDPNRETAYRYWGDALSANGKIAEAREKYIQAIVADPYNNRGWIGLNQWAQRMKVKLNWVHLQDKSKATTAGSGNATITIDPSIQKDDPTLGGWLAYSATRLTWQREKFKQEFPKESQYRHTLREEADALNAIVEVLSSPENIPKLDPSMAALVKIDQAGFIEPFALLNRADKEIAQDYPAYRDAHRDILYRYFDEFVVPRVPAQ